MRKRYNTPHRSRVVKTRMTEEEYAEFAERLSAYNMSQAEFIRQAITGAAIRPIITVSPVNDELLAAVGKLTAEYGRCLLLVSLCIHAQMISGIIVDEKNSR